MNTIVGGGGSPSAGKPDPRGARPFHRASRQRAAAAGWTIAALAAFGPASARGADRALLVGLERYADARVPETPGAEDDARAMAAMLRAKFGFAQDGIKLLLGRQATGAAIVEAFREWLVTGTQPGDRVFFHYAGHGSQVRDDNGDEADGYDETLAPYDVDPETGRNAVRDDAFEDLIAGLQGRRAVLVFDSCHSGTISRGNPGLARFPKGGGARYLPRPDQFHELHKAAGDAAARYVVSAAGDTRGQGSQGSGFLGERERGGVTGVVVISAAGPDQIAFPMEVGDSVRGALSYVLEDLHAAAVPSVGEVRTRLADRFRDLQRTRKLTGSQVPQTEVLSPVPVDDHPLFVSWDLVPALVLANPRSALRVSIATLAGRTRYRVGDPVAYRVETSAAGYLYLLVFSSDRSAGCLFPDADTTDNRVPAGTTTLPRPGREPFEVQEPLGRDLVVALLASRPLALPCDEGFTWEGLLSRVGIDALARAVTAAATTRGAPAPPLDWQAAVVALETVP